MRGIVRRYLTTTILALFAISWLAACGGTRPAQQIVGAWENTFRPGHIVEFRADGRYIELYPGGGQFVGRYTLEQNGAQITMQARSGAVSSGPLRFDGDTLVLLGTPFQRSQSTLSIGLEATPTAGVQRATAGRSSAAGAAPEAVKRPSPIPQSPIAIAQSAPVVSPIIVAQPATPSATPIQAIVSAPSAPAQLQYQVAETDDHFVAIREQPTTNSREISRLSAGNRIVCTSITHGETLEYLGRRSDQWAVCPSVGGYVFLLLLIPE